MTPCGSSGSNCSRAATATIGETTVASSRTTRCSMVSGPKGRVALGTPILVDFPPHKTMPPAVILRYRSWFHSQARQCFSRRRLLEQLLQCHHTRPGDARERHNEVVLLGLHGKKSEAS